MIAVYKIQTHIKGAVQVKPGRMFRVFMAICVLGSILFSTMSCEDPNRALTRAERKLIDSFYHQQLVILQADLDTTCSRQHDSIFEAKFDSILEKRKAERIQIMGQYSSKFIGQ